MTGCERILARLERGPATAAELYAETFSIVHSRIADLRKRGYVITCERDSDKTGAASYLYRLEVSGSDPQASRPTGPPSPAGLDADPSAFSEPDQLTLTGVAA